MEAFFACATALCLMAAFTINPLFFIPTAVCFIGFMRAAR